MNPEIMIEISKIITVVCVSYLVAMLTPEYFTFKEIKNNYKKLVENGEETRDWNTYIENYFHNI